ncbi:MAG TPA: carotenoid biosynthesis protein [Jatrophihabitans sp.]|nr:carotenoid biosynthesis protein [Jatrophihabitans sp.]
MAVQQQVSAPERRLAAPPARTVARWRSRPAEAVALVAICLQIGYPLTGGSVRDVLTVAVVVAFSVACLLHAGATRGPRVAVGALLATALPGFAVELVGVHTSIPFGGYRYTGGLGYQLLGVPIVVALAWTMLAWPAAIAARRLVSGRMARVALGAWALTAADLFLDPQMVRAGYWHWQHATPHLPGVPGVPLTNLAGWLLASLAISACLQRLLETADCGGHVPGDGLAVGLYLWLWAGWSVALAVFLGVPTAAAWGAAGMGTVAIPLALRARR